MGYMKDLRKKIGTAPSMMVGACVLIFNEQSQLLLQKRIDNHCWGLAGGSMELGETLEQVAMREMLEETGFTLRELKLFNTFSGPELYYKYPHGDEVYNVVTAFVCTDYHRTLAFDKAEASAIRFFDLDKLPKEISPPDQVVLGAYVRNERLGLKLSFRLDRLCSSEAVYGEGIDSHRLQSTKIKILYNFFFRSLTFLNFDKA